MIIKLNHFQDYFIIVNVLNSLNLKFYRNNVTDMNGMFCGCSSLKELNLNNFNTDMNGIFCGCSSLKELNLNNFNTNNVTKMNGMFRGCSSLKELNIIILILIMLLIWVVYSANAQWIKIKN